MKKLVCISLLLCSPAWAGESLEAGEGMFSRMQYDEAMRLAEQTLISARADIPELVRAYRLKGLCQAAMNQSREAVKTFRRLLSIDSLFRLEKGLSPKYTAPFYQAVALSEETGYLRLKNKSAETRSPDDEPGLILELVSDPLGMVSFVRLNFWTGDRQPLQIRREVDGPAVIEIPLPFIRRAGEVGYYFEALNQHGAVVARLGSRSKPFTLKARTEADLAAAGVTPPAESVPPEPNSLAEAESGRRDSWYTSWWFWTIVGVVAAGTATGVTLALMGDSGGGNDYQVTWEHR